MSDHADIADAKIFSVAVRSLAAIRRRPVLEPNCHCHFCDEVVAPGALFCDADCRDDYDKEQDGLRRSGLR